MDPNIFYGSCRCCLGIGYHRNIMKEYSDNNKKEIYINLFVECFNLYLSTNKDISSLICSKCIQQLEEANTFRLTVIHNEQRLLDTVPNKDMIFVNVPGDGEVIIKDEQDSDSVGGVSDDDSDYKPDEDLVDHTEEQNCIENGLVKGEAELLGRFEVAHRLPTRKSLYTNGCSAFVKHLDRLKDTIILPNMITHLIQNDKEATDNKKIYITEKMAYVLNTSMVLENSNVTPFKSKNRCGFPCFYCRNIFHNLGSLKDHQKTHNKSELKKILRTFGPECLVVYVDITELQCTLCKTQMPNLNELKTHLIRKHHKKFYSDFTDRVIPFKLSEGKQSSYECQICGFSFQTFGSIERHMNVHYRNYVCKECGTGFVTKYRLKVHTKSMHMGGTYPCDVCKKVFSTQQKHKNHVDTVHKLVKRFKCTHCNERFSEYFRRQKHIVDVHNGQPLQYKCNVCDKVFDRRYTLSRHMKRDHLEERDYQCQLCAYKCFTNNELRVHMVKHNGERIFECSVCHKAYARKKTLREHMRIHNNDRRFACNVCGQAFVQKCSLKGHVKTHHVEYNIPL
ncbi:zinc finger protein 431-like [Leptidea sinapis]|uniref:zinc finger protein 431-like n=1 Tax=Leptidea sinapis TaxID=189913 RepID=UPI00213D385F|nr:zinc finger protein 431-like [Leptidea sinapis]